MNLEDLKVHILGELRKNSKASKKGGDGIDDTTYFN